ncbi:hypothetical protein UACE39S_00151 [Ureibacillus acetophenoni]
MLKIKKTGSIFIISLIVILLVLPQSVVNAKENRFFEINEITGVAYVQKAGSMKSIRAVLGMKLQQGDRIQTEDFSSILLETSDSKDQVTIDEETEISIVHLHENDGSKITTLKVWKGSVYADVTPVKNENGRFQIISSGTIFKAKGTHFIVTINPTTGLPTMFVSAGAVEVNQENTPNNIPVQIYPSQQISYFPELSSNLNSGINVVDMEQLVQNASPAIIEAILRNKQQIDEENRRTLSTINNPSDLNVDSESELERVKQNIDNALANLLKSAINNKNLSQEEERRLIDTYNNNNSSGSAPFDMNNVPNLKLSEEEKRKQQHLLELEEKRKQQQEEKERKQQELVSQNQILIQRIEEERRKLEEENRLAAERKAKEAQERFLVELSEQMQQTFLNRQKEQEQLKKAQEQQQQEKRNPTSPWSSTGGESPSPISPDQVAANGVIGKINTIPNVVTIENLNLVRETRESYEALTEPQKALVTNLQKLIDSELEIERLLKIQEITEQIVTVIENEISIILEMNNVREAKKKIYETRLMIDSLSEQSIVNSERLAEFEVVEVELVDELIANLEESQFQYVEVRNLYNRLKINQKASLSNEESFFEKEVNFISNKVNELLEIELISLEQLDQIDFINHYLDLLDDEQKVRIDERINEQLDALVQNKESFLSLEGNLNEYINYLIERQNELTIHYLNNIYEQENLTDEQQAAILSSFDKYFMENNRLYQFITESLNYSIDNQVVVYLTDGNNVISIPIFSDFQSVEDLKDYIKNYTDDNLILSIDINEENELTAKASLPNLYLYGFEIWLNEYLLD